LPFMNLTSYCFPSGCLTFVGPIANLIGGADVSYFVAAIAAFVAYALIARREKT